MAYLLVPVNWQSLNQCQESLGAPCQDIKEDLVLRKELMVSSQRKRQRLSTSSHKSGCRKRENEQRSLLCEGHNDSTPMGPDYMKSRKRD